MKKIAVSNQKGGVGKTTVSINLGAGLARAGKRVLIIDCDPQGNVSGHFDAETEHALSELISEGLKDCIIEVRDGLHIIPSGRSRLYGAQKNLTRSDDGIGDFVERLSFLNAFEYDFVFCDLSPTDTMINRAALVFCDGLLIPINPSLDAVVGAQRYLDVIDEELNRIRARRGRPALKVYGFLMNMADGTILSKEVEDLTRKKWKRHVFDARIRKNVSLGEARTQNKTIFEYAPFSHGAEDFEALTREILSDGEKIKS